MTKQIRILNIEIRMYLGGIDVSFNGAQKMHEGKQLGNLGLFVRSKCHGRVYEYLTSRNWRNGRYLGYLEMFQLNSVQNVNMEHGKYLGGIDMFQSNSELNVPK